MWHDTKFELPKQNEDVLLLISDGTVHEGMFLKNANKYHKNINRWKIYKRRKTLAFDEVIMWRYLPKVGIVPSANS